MGVTSRVARVGLRIPFECAGGKMATPQSKFTSHSHTGLSSSISASDMLPSPLDQFHLWFRIAQQHGVSEPDIVSIATSSDLNFPSVRFVLLKEVDSRGFVFCTNYRSRKSQELLSNPHAAIAFYWREISRQVRVVGKAEKVDELNSDTYWNMRPRESQISAWASDQSAVVGEDELAKRVEDVEKRFAGVEMIPRPPFWGGWRIVPLEVEFWCGKSSRLHDRVRYLRADDSSAEWSLEKLAP